MTAIAVPLPGSNWLSGMSTARSASGNGWPIWDPDELGVYWRICISEELRPFPPTWLKPNGLYMSGQLGFAKRLLGLTLIAPAFARLLLSFRYQIFSIRCFDCVANPRHSLFNEESILRIRQTGSGARTANRPYLVGLRWIHSLAAAIVAAVFVAR
jgi:hypothetical protein